MGSDESHFSVSFIMEARVKSQNTVHKPPLPKTKGTAGRSGGNGTDARPLWNQTLYC